MILILLKHLLTVARGVTTPNARMATVDYSSLTVPELKALLDERAVDYASNAKKQDLIDLLEG